MKTAAVSMDSGKWHEEQTFTGQNNFVFWMKTLLVKKDYKRIQR